MIAAGILILVSDQRADAESANFVLTASWRIGVRSLLCGDIDRRLVWCCRESLQAHTDNIRWTVNARFIRVDRSLTVRMLCWLKHRHPAREITYPPLSNTIGYANLQFGK